MPSSTLNVANVTDAELSQLEKLTIELSVAVKQIRAANLATKAASNDQDPCKQAMLAANGILSLLRGPRELMLDSWAMQISSAALSLFDDFGGFHHIPVDGDISYADLAQKLDADVSLIRRITSPLIAAAILRHVDGDRVAHTTKSRTFADGKSIRHHNIIFNTYTFPAMLAMHSYFAKYGRKEPTTRRHTVLSYAHGRPELTMWEMMRQQGPEDVRRFMDTMAIWSEDQPVFGAYDFGWIVDEADKQPQRPLLVDVGASKGHATKAILQSTPGLEASRCVLQDLPEVVEELERLDDEELRGAKKMIFDFHKEQPVKGALVYFIRTCLHDYGDDESVKILRVLADAMADDSRLLILEQVLTDPPGLFGSTMDICMMTIGGKERNREQWADITARSGLRILKIHQDDDNALMCAVECVKVK